MSSELVGPFIEALFVVGVLIAICVAVLVLSKLDALGYGVVVLAELERGVVRRRGRVHHVLGAGIHWVTPFVEELTRVSTREINLALPALRVTSRAAPRVSILTEITFRVADPATAVQHESYLLATADAAKQQLRELCAWARPDDLGAHLEATELRIRDRLDAATAAWGVRVSRVSLCTEAPERPREPDDGALAEARSEA